MESVTIQTSEFHQQPLNSLGSQLNDVTNQHPPTPPSPIMQGINKVVNVVKSLVDLQRQGGKKTQTNKVNEIDTYIAKILGKIKGERKAENGSEEPSSRKSVTSAVAQENAVKTIERSQPALQLDTDKASKASQEAPVAGSARIKSGLNNLNAPKEPERLLGDILKISRQKVSFGATLPGKIIEESFEVYNKSNEDIMVQIYTQCSNSEFDHLDEYVYSMRRSQMQDYNDKHHVIMTPRSMASFKIALKVPSMKLENNNIIGESRIVVKGVKGMQKIALEANVTVPRIICPKELYHRDFNASIIKLAIKLSKKPETKFPLKNLSDFPVVLNLGFYKAKNVEEDPLFDCVITPNTIAVPAQGTVLLNLGLKNWKALINSTSEGEVKSFKRILIGSARNSAIVYSFLLMVEIY